MKKFKEYLNEDVPANAVGAGMQGLNSTEGNPISGFDPVMMGGKLLRRKAPSMFGGKAVFKVPSDAFHKARLGKVYRKWYRSYVPGDIGEEIRQYASENPDAPIIVEDEKTGAMVYLKHGKR